MSSWTKSVISTIDEVVDFVRSKIVAPAHKAARASVYSLVIGLLLLLSFIFVLISAFRVTTLAVDTHWAYMIWGGIFFAVGLLLWSKK